MQRISETGFILFCLFLLFHALLSCKAKDSAPPYAIAIHGGAGTLGKNTMTPEKEQVYIQALSEALDLGEKILADGGSALDAVEKTVEYLENNPLFNAGKGAVFTHDGTHELDASIMDGSTLAAGAVGGVRNIKNPIRLARKVMEHSPHVFLTGRGAETFGLLQGLDTVPNHWFDTEHRRESWQKALERERLDSLQGQGYQTQPGEFRFGTVGCVALDRQGNLAAATSTGGMTNKKWGRLGDAPVIGAGTYAENGVAAVSCTGDGEYFIRSAVAYDLVARMKYGGQSVKQAGDAIIHQKLPQMGGKGGLISLDARGNIHLPFNSEGMYRAWAKPGARSVNIFESFN
jgi:beta-aspartyl-peptidase (threonine type)